MTTDTKISEIPVKSDLFKEVKYYVTGSISPEIRKLLENGGAKCTSIMFTDITHLLCGTDFDEKDIAEAIDIYDIPSVTEKWVIASAQLSRLACTKVYNPLSNGLFVNTVAAIVQLNASDRKRMYAFITFHGGRVERNITPKTTHLICGAPNGSIYRQAIDLKSDKLAIVTPDWFFECIKAEELLDTTAYHPRLLNPVQMNHMKNEDNRSLSSILGLDELAANNISSTTAAATTTSDTIVKSTESLHLNATKATSMGETKTVTSSATNSFTNATPKPGDTAKPSQFDQVNARASSEGASESENSESKVAQPQVNQKMPKNQSTEQQTKTSHMTITTASTQPIHQDQSQNISAMQQKPPQSSQLQQQLQQPPKLDNQSAILQQQLQGHAQTEQNNQVHNVNINNMNQMVSVLNNNGNNAMETTQASVPNEQIQQFQILPQQPPPQIHQNVQQINIISNETIKAAPTLPLHQQQQHQQIPNQMKMDQTHSQQHNQGLQQMMKNDSNVAAQQRTQHQQQQHQIITQMPMNQPNKSPQVQPQQQQMSHQIIVNQANQIIGQKQLVPNQQQQQFLNNPQNQNIRRGSDLSNDGSELSNNRPQMMQQQQNQPQQMMKNDSNMAAHSFHRTTHMPGQPNQGPQPQIQIQNQSQQPMNQAMVQQQHQQQQQSAPNQQITMNYGNNGNQQMNQSGQMQFIAQSPNQQVKIIQQNMPGQQQQQQGPPTQRIIVSQQQFNQLTPAQQQQFLNNPQNQNIRRGSDLSNDGSELANNQPQIVFINQQTGQQQIITTGQQMQQPQGGNMGGMQVQQQAQMMNQTMIQQQQRNVTSQPPIGVQNPNQPTNYPQQMQNQQMPNQQMPPQQFVQQQGMNQTQGPLTQQQHQQRMQYLQSLQGHSALPINEAAHHLNDGSELPNNQNQIVFINQMQNMQQKQQQMQQPHNQTIMISGSPSACVVLSANEKNDWQRKNDLQQQQQQQQNDSNMAAHSLHRAAQSPQQQPQPMMPNQAPMQKIHVQNVPPNQVILPGQTPQQSPMQQIQSPVQQQPPQQMNASPGGPPQFIRATRPQWQAGQPQRQLIHLDAQTHAHLQTLDPIQRADYLGKLQKRNLLLRQHVAIQQSSSMGQPRPPGQQMNIIVRGQVPGGQMQWIQQQQQQQQQQQRPILLRNPAPGLSPISQQTVVNPNVVNQQQSPQAQQQQGQPQFPVDPNTSPQFQRLQIQQQTAQKPIPPTSMPAGIQKPFPETADGTNIVIQQQQIPNQTIMISGSPSALPINEAAHSGLPINKAAHQPQVIGIVPQSPTIDGVPPQAQMNKTKTALANMLSNRLGGSNNNNGAAVPMQVDQTAEPSAAGTLRMMTAQHNAALNPGVERTPQEMLSMQQQQQPPQQSPQAIQTQNIQVGAQRRTLGNITNNSPIVAAPINSQVPPNIVPAQAAMVQSPVATGLPGAPSPNRPSPLPRPQFYGHNPNLKLPPELFLLGCIFFIVEYDESHEKDLSEWKTLIRQHGGEIENVYCPRVTHVLCRTQRHGVVMQAIRDSKRCVTAYWLGDTMSRKQVLPPSQALHLPMPSTFGTQRPASKHIISMSGFEGEERARVKKMVEESGALLTVYLSRHNSVLICKKAEGSKYKKAKEWNIPVVNCLWLNDILQGNLSHMSQYDQQKYQQFNLTGPFRIDYTLIAHLMTAWKSPINLTQDCHERVKRFLAEPVSEPKPKKMRKYEPLEVIPDEIVCNEKPEQVPRIIFSQVDNLDGLKKAVVALGGEVSTDPTTATHIVLTRLARTPKLLLALGAVDYILNSKWIVDSAKAGKFLPTDEYMWNDEEFNEFFKCDIQETIKAATRKTLFTGKAFYITPSVTPEPKTLTKMIEFSGGKVEPKRRSASQIAQANNTAPESYTILTCTKDMHLLVDLMKSNKPNRTICTTELVLSAVMQQKIEVEPHIIKYF